MKHSIKVRVMWATFISYTVIVGLLIYVWLSALLRCVGAIISINESDSFTSSFSYFSSCGY